MTPSASSTGGVTGCGCLVEPAADRFIFQTPACLCVFIPSAWWRRDCEVNTGTSAGLLLASGELSGSPSLMGRMCGGEISAATFALAAVLTCCFMRSMPPSFSSVCVCSRTPGKGALPFFSRPRGDAAFAPLRTTVGEPDDAAIRSIFFLWIELKLFDMRRVCSSGVPATAYRKRERDPCSHRAFLISAPSGVAKNLVGRSV
mmetsp:Transcript_8517/g.21507  ORF Transcript_8517/g.21507 Transcript_8517/m.21507 type:complete len:202 (-) Transcript_8517:658-1263(-)